LMHLEIEGNCRLIYQKPNENHLKNEITMRLML